MSARQEGKTTVVFRDDDDNPVRFDLTWDDKHLEYVGVCPECGGVAALGVDEENGQWHEYLGCLEPECGWNEWVF